MTTLKRVLLLLSLLSVLVFAGNVWAQDETAAEPATDSAPQGVELGVLILGVVSIVGIAGYLAANTKTGKDT